MNIRVRLQFELAYYNIAPGSLATTPLELSLPSRYYLNSYGGVLVV